MSEIAAAQCNIFSPFDELLCILRYRAKCALLQPYAVDWAIPVLITIRLQLLLAWLQAQ